MFGVDLLLVFYFTLFGMGLGTLSGLAPGIHVNTLAILLLMTVPSLYPMLDGICQSAGSPVPPALLISCTILSAAICHSFLDFIPSLIMGVPDETECLSVLPSHRLLLEGRGLCALQAAAQGSLVGAMAGIIVLMPLPLVYRQAIDLLLSLVPMIPWLLLFVPFLLVWAEGGKADPKAELDMRDGGSSFTETISLKRHVPVHGDSARVIGELRRRHGRWEVRTPMQTFRVRGRGFDPGHQKLLGHWTVRKDRLPIITWCVLLFFASGALGVMAMDGLVPGDDLWRGMEGNMLMPLFTGLFGLPLLIGSSRGRMPEQNDDPGDPPSVLGALKGSFMGGLVGWLPGVTATAGAVLTTMLPRSGENGPDGFISMVSAVGTGAAVLGLGTLLLLGKGRSGTLLAMQVATPSLAVDSLPALLLCVLTASLLSYWLTMKLGARLLRQAQGRDLGMLNQVALVGMVLLSFLLAGPGGLVLLFLSTVLGSVPAKLGVSRVHLTGCLLLPILLYYFAPFLR
ncbi:MAG TPA: tripartite tricarboxylate transporter permease [Methanomassiliicoccales archaeon]|nr:tripartite tricarboxylate transporter permease [Methanomassiliicoccales archaeon]